MVYKHNDVQNNKAYQSKKKINFWIQPVHEPDIFWISP